MAHEAHHPHVHGKSLGALALELLMIGVGVFLGLQVDQWKENRQHRELARAALENFRTELTQNQAALASQVPYHAALARGFRPFLGPSAPAPRTVGELFERVGWQGSGAVAFRRTAWDVALANQALTYLDQRLAFAVADVYLSQQRYEEYQLTTQRAALNPASLRPDALGGLGLLLGVYYNDAAQSNDPQLASLYRAVLPRIDSALGKLRD